MLFSFEDRIVHEAYYIIENRTTVRSAAKEFGLSKSCIHKDVSVRLKSINPSLYEEVKKVLEYNFSTKHIRGGISTRNKYKGKV